MQHILKFDNFSLLPTDFVLDDNLLAFDLSFDSKESFDKFDLFYIEHIDDKNSFDFQLDNSTYHGRFGALIYDLEYNARFYMTTAPYNMSSPLFMDVINFNTPEILNNHEKRLLSLVEILVEKNILTKDEANAFSPYLTPYEKGIDIKRQVRCLNDYLVATENTLDDIRKDITTD